MQSRFSHCYCHCNSLPNYTIVLNNYYLCCRGSWLCKGFWLYVQNFRNRTDFLLFVVLVDSSCRCKGFVCSALDYYNSPVVLFVCRNFQNCMGILLLSIRCNSNFVVVGDLYCMDCKVPQIVVGSRDMGVRLYIRCRNLGDKLDYSFLLLRRRTCYKKEI